MMMDEIEVAAVWLLHKKNAKRKVNRKMWVHAATVSSVWKTRYPSHVSTAKK